LLPGTTTKKERRLSEVCHIVTSRKQMSRKQDDHDEG